MIFTITMNPAIDKHVRAGRVRPEEKIRCELVHRSAGGGGVNVTRAVRRLGGTSRALWVRAGNMGALYGDLLDEEGLAHVPIDEEGETRENLIVAEESTGEQYRFGMPGPTVGGAARHRVLDAATICGCAWVVASGSLPPGVPPEFYRELGERVTAAGKRFVLDTSGAALAEGVKAGPTILKPNQKELCSLAGCDIDAASDAEVERAARGLMERHGVQLVLASMGGAGAMLVTPEGGRRVPSPKVKVISPVGAGDSSMAGLLMALDEGRSPEDAAMMAVAAGADAVRTEGFELCTKGGTLELYRELERGRSA